jgi:plastocyanin
MLLIAIPATVLTIASYRRTPYIKALAVIFIGAAVVGGSTLFAFGLVTPKAPSVVEEGGGEEGGETAGNDNNNQQPQGQQQQQQQTTQPVQLTKVSILPGASAEGNPDYDPENLNVPMGVGIQWINNDNVPHTVTSLKDDGKSFDSSIILPNGNYTLDTSALDESEYEYFCTLHPYMKAKFLMSTDAAPTASGPNSQNNSGTGNISSVAGSKQQAANETNDNTMENNSNGNNSTEGIINTAKNNSINELQVSNANGTSITNMSAGTSTSSISTISIVSGSSLPSNREFYVPKTVETTVGSILIGRMKTLALIQLPREI